MGKTPLTGPLGRGGRARGDSASTRRAGADGTPSRRAGAPEPRLRPSYWERAVAELGRRDRVMRELIARHGPEGLRGRGDAYYTLARAVVGQQISVRAADEVWRRLEGLLGRVAPGEVLRAGEAALLACGLSRRKVGYLEGLAVDAEAGAFAPEGFEGMADHDVARNLMRRPGVGRWTAEMFLIFHLLRPDVLPVGDIGLCRAVSALYGEGAALAPAAVHGIAERWRPWRTVATWFLWRTLDPVPLFY